MKFGLIKITAASNELCAGDVKANTRSIIDAIVDAHSKGSQIIVMPKLSLVGAASGALLLNRTVSDACEKGLMEIAAATKGRDIMAVVGLPLRVDDKMFDASAVLSNGKVCAVIPCPNPLSGFAVPLGLGYDTITVGSYAVPFSPNIILRNASDNDLNIAVCAGEGIYTDFFRLNEYSLAGVNLILNPTAVMRMLGDESRINMLKALSKSLRCAIVSTSSGKGESTSEGVYSGEKYILENGVILASGGREVSYVVNDIDTEILYNARMNAPSKEPSTNFMFCDVKIPQAPIVLDRQFSRFPYVPTEPQQFAKTLDILAEGVFDRFESVKADSIVLGVSGGTDSTCVMMVLNHMCKKFGISPSKIIGITMQGLGSGVRTQTNAKRLIKALRCTHIDIPIVDAVKSHLKQIGNLSLTNITAENAQARERTQVLFDVANAHNGIVMGTGDMSEIALGWSTYGGDQAAHYNCISSLPKTFIKALLRHISFYSENKQLAIILADILDTPISPELLKNQITENILGPYELHDFYLYHLIEQGFSPKKVVFLASRTFPDYSQNMIKKTLRTFINRFFKNQFKRSASCDGIRLNEFNLSTIDFPSDLSAETYLDF